jgi:site-specific recombinase XerD
MKLKRSECELIKTQQRFLERTSLSARPSTGINARTATNNFIRYLKSHYPELSCFSELARHHVEGWLRHLANQGLKRSTRRNYIIKVQGFLRKIKTWGWKEAPRVYSFCRGDRPPEDRGLPKPLSEDVDRALQEELRKRGGFIHKALLLLRATGLRTKELLDLKVDDLRKQPGGGWALYVPIGKLHSERVIPVDADTAKLFNELRSMRGPAPPVKDPETGKLANFLITRPTGRRYGRDAFRYHLGKIEKEAKLREHPAPHRLRHGYATELLRAGIRLPVLMKLLGHRTIAMTLRYAEVTGIDVQRAYMETMEVLKSRYEIPAPPRILKHSGGKSSREAIVSYIQALATHMEAFRRDHAKPSEKKKIQRFVERLRRLAYDFRDLSS